MNTRDNKQLATAILRLAATVEVGDTPTKSETLEGLFQTVQNQMKNLINEMQKADASATRKIHLQRLDQMLGDLDDLWREVKPALED